MNKEVFVQNIKKYCNLKGVKPTVACRESGVGTSFINNIESRGQTPSVEKVQMLADYLGVTTSDLLGEKEEALYEMVTETQAQDSLEKLFETANENALQMLKRLKYHIESSVVPAHRQVDAPLTMRLSAEVFQISDKQADEQQFLDPAQLRLLNAITDALAELNAEGQEKLIDYAADLVASGRYIKSDSSDLGQKKA